MQNYPRLASAIIGIIKHIPAFIKSVSYVSAAFTGGLAAVAGKLATDVI
jgi:hypothetical protein